MTKTNFRRVLLLVGIVATAVGCSTTSEQTLPGLKQSGEARFRVCHGFNCYFSTDLAFSGADARTVARYFRGVGTPVAERAAISRAVQHFEKRSTDAIGVADGAKSSLAQSGKRGQMDCIDESENTRKLLLYLAGRGLLKHHRVEQNTSRGIIFDGRYFHSTAVVADHAGKRWAIDSWYEAAGGPPDIMPLEEWRQRGVLGER